MADLPKGVVWDPEETHKSRYTEVKRNIFYALFGAFLLLGGISTVGTAEFGTGLILGGVGLLMMYLFWWRSRASKGGAFAAAGGKAIINDREIVECPSCGLRTMNGQRHRFGDGEVIAVETRKSTVSTGPSDSRTVYRKHKFRVTVPDSRRVHSIDCPKCSTDLQPTKTGVVFPSNRDATVRCSNCGTTMTLGRWSELGGEPWQLELPELRIRSRYGDEDAVYSVPRDKIDIPHRPFWMETYWTASGGCPNCHTIAVPDVIDKV